LVETTVARNYFFQSGEVTRAGKRLKRISDELKAITGRRAARCEAVCERDPKSFARTMKTETQASVPAVKQAGTKLMREESHKLFRAPSLTTQPTSLS